VLVTHDQQEALMFGDRVAVMRAGVIEQLGTPAEVYRRPRTERVARFVGDANLLHGDAEGPCVVTALGELPTVAPHHGPVTVLCRPGDLLLEPGLGGEVIASSYVGQETAYEVRLTSGEQVTTRAYGVPQLQTGSSVAVRYRG